MFLSYRIVLLPTGSFETNLFSVSKISKDLLQHVTHVSRLWRYKSVKLARWRCTFSHWMLPRKALIHWFQLVSVAELRCFNLLCYSNIFIFIFTAHANPSAWLDVLSWYSVMLLECMVLYHIYYISTTGFLNPASKRIVTPDDERNDLISYIPRDSCADEGVRCIRPPFPFSYNLSWNQSCL